MKTNKLWSFVGHSGRALEQTLSVGLLTALMASSAYAVPTSVDPSQVEGRFHERIPTAPADKPSAVPALPKHHVSKGDESKRFHLHAVAIDGSTVYTQEQLKPLFADALNHEISMAEAHALADRVTVKYRNDGYILSQAVLPNNAVRDGVLHIRVIEGYIAHVTIQGEVKDRRAVSLVESYGEKIKQARPLNTKTLERYLLLMNDLPGATAKGVVKPSTDTYGAADLVVTITNRVYGGSLGVDNRGSRYIGRNQYTATLTENSMLDLEERTLGRYITTGVNSELRYYEIQHEEQIGREGTKATLTASHSATAPGGPLSALHIQGNSNDYQAKVSHPFERSRTENLTGRAIFDYRNTDTDTLGFELSNDRTRVLRLGGEYDFMDRFQGVDLFDTQLSQGLDVLNSSSRSTIESRADADTSFTKINLDVTRTHPLPNGFSVFTAASGQYAFNNRLLPSEQFSLGGPGFGGAYDPAELTGDEGIAGKIELRYGHTVGYQYLASYQAFAYLDGGAIWNNTDKTPRHNALSSTGLGVRSNFTPWLLGSAEVGLPLNKVVAAENNKDPRVFFSLTGRF